MIMTSYDSVLQYTTVCVAVCVAVRHSVCCSTLRCLAVDTESAIMTLYDSVLQCMLQCALQCMLQCMLQYFAISCSTYGVTNNDNDFI